MSSLSVTELELLAHRKYYKVKQRPQHGNSLQCCKDSCKNEHNDFVSMSLLKSPEEEVANGGRKIG